MPQKFINQAVHNEDFHTTIVSASPEEFFDWKCTVLYYAALFYMKAYLVHKGEPAGESHDHVLMAVNPRTGFPGVAEHCFNTFKSMHRKSMAARYEFGCFLNSAEAQKEEHRQHEQNLIFIKRTLQGRYGLPI